MILLISAAASLQSAESAWVSGKTEKSQVRLIAPWTSVDAKTGSIRVGIEFKLAPGWHVYWKNPGDIGYPPKAEWQLPPNWTHSDLQFPIPKKFTSSGFTGYGYQDRVVYLVDLSGPGIQEKFFQASATLEYLVCEVQCLPERVNLTLSIKNAQEEISPHARLIDQIYSELPSSLSPAIYQIEDLKPQSLRLKFTGAQSIADVFPFVASGKTGIEVELIADNQFLISSPHRLPSIELLAVWKDGKATRGGTINVPAASMFPDWRQLVISLLLAFLGGLILNLMPCVLPVIGLKTISLVKLGLAQSSEVRKSALWTCAGILASFLGLAVLILLVRATGQQIGWGFQFQSPGFIILMITIIYVFSLNMFGLFEFSLPASGSRSLSNLSKGPFWEGALATLLATPCSAPFLGTALTFALTQPAWLLTIFFLTMGLGLSTPYLLLAILPSALKIFPRPGPWMETLKRFLGYSLLLAVLWLLYVLLQQTSVLFLFAIITSLLLISIGLRELKGLRAWIVVLAVTVIAILAAEKSALKDTSSMQRSTQFSETLIPDKIREGKTLYVVVTADWCLTCKYNEKFVMGSTWFQELISTHKVEIVTFDWTTRDESIARFLKAYNRVAIPFSMLISKNRSVVFPELLNRPNVEEHFEKFFQR